VTTSGMSTCKYKWDLSFRGVGGGGFAALSSRWNIASCISIKDIVVDD
jgi:hypothetical protein